MSTQHGRIPSFRHFVKLDRIAVTLIGLFLLTQLSALVLWNEFFRAGPGTGGSTPVEQNSEPTSAILFVGLFISAVVLLLLFWGVYRRLPTWARYVVLAVVGLSWIMYRLYPIYQSDGILPVAIIAFAGLGSLGILIYLHRNRVAWLVHNLAALVLAIAGGVLLGLWFSPVVIGLILVALVALDYLEVSKSSMMSNLVGFSASFYVPNYVIIPSKWRIDLSELRDWLVNLEEKDSPDSVASIIGVGDFVFPGALTVSAAAAIGTAVAWPVAGSLVGVCVAAGVLRASMSRSDEKGLPALPWLNTGAIAGFIVGIAISPVPFYTIIGL